MSDTKAIISKKPLSSNYGKQKTQRIVGLVVTILVIIGGLLAVFPIFWMIRTSFMSNLEINTYPPRLLPSIWYFSNFPEALTTFPFGRYLINTLTIALPSIVGTILTASLAAYAFARLEFSLKSFWFALVIGSMLMPTAVFIIPIFITWSKIGLFGTYAPLIVPAFLGGGAFNIFLIRQFMMTIPRDIDEAAKIDGASHMTTLYRILLPLIKPVLISVGLFTFIIYWNDLLGPVIYISDPNMETISQGLANYVGGFGTNWRLLMASSCLSVAPAILLYLIGQNYFIEGIVLTGLKS